MATHRPAHVQPRASQQAPPIWLWVIRCRDWSLPQALAMATLLVGASTVLATARSEWRGNVVADVLAVLMWCLLAACLLAVFARRMRRRE